LDLSIIIVSYNTRELTLECLRSIYEQTKRIEFEILVVDNASSDGSPDAVATRFPGVRVVRLLENVGFARANNLAAELARGDYLLLLNPDTVVLEGAAEKLHAFAKQHREEGVFGGRTLFADGSLNPASCWGQPTIWSVFCRATGLAKLFRGALLFDPESLGGWARDTVREVPIVSGCFLLVPRSLWDRLGGFDPLFFMYGEDADFCLRARSLGAKCIICPDARIVHYLGASEKVRADKMVRLFRAKAQFFRRHWSPQACRFGVRMFDIQALGELITYGCMCRLSQ
jgi:N-acetylglucosaminyl-diphospho-decaprenol L-rhamnosyltransferase